MFFVLLRTNILNTRIAVIGLILLGACASPVQVADNYIAQDEWMKAVLSYRKAAADYPTDVEYKSRLKQTELKAADYYYQRGLSLFEKENFDGALIQYQQGLAAMPDHGKLQQAMRQVMLRKEANNLYADALKAKEAGQPDEYLRLLKRALDAYPGFKLAEDLLTKESNFLAEEESVDRLKVSSRAPITLNFRQTDIRTAFEFIAKSFGIDVVFDEGVKTFPVTLFAKDVTFEEALSLILATTKTFYKKVGSNTILIAPESKEKRGQYEDQMVRVFQLTNINAKEMVEILKGVTPLKKVIVNEALNTVVVRDTEEAIKVAEKVIAINDKRPAEIILEVEILEVNRSKAERLGLDFGSYNVKASIPSTANIPVNTSIGDAYQNAGMLTFPSATFNFYKQDVDAKTLANPRVRVLSGKSAKIHIGDRVPLRATTIQDATGQVRTTYDYKDIGIKLTAEPVIHLDNSVTVKLGLEVSSLGQNIGTLTEPAYSIGTRNAETFMLLRDGETAILGGLIREEDRKSRTSVPLLGDIPGLGWLFTSKDDTGNRTDVLLTITPRVVRGWDMPDKESQMFVSGSEDRFNSQPLFSGFGVAKTGTSMNSSSSLTQSKDTRAQTAPPKSLKDTTSVVEKNSASKSTVKEPTAPESGQQSLLAFSEAVYESESGKEFEIKLTGVNLDGVKNLVAEILYNPQLVKYLRNEPGSIVSKEYKVEADVVHGILRVSLTYPENSPAQGTGVLARIILNGEKPGTSYITYRQPIISTVKEGAAASIQVRSSRIVVK